jgi:hypothetical protein
VSLLRNITSGLRSLFQKEQVDRELNEELSAYLEMEAAEKMKQGMSPKDALRAVRLERGSLEVTKEVVRSGGWESLGDVLAGPALWRSHPAQVPWLYGSRRAYLGARYRRQCSDFFSCLRCPAQASSI